MRYLLTIILLLALIVASGCTLQFKASDVELSTQRTQAGVVEYKLCGAYPTVFDNLQKSDTVQIASK